MATLISTKTQASTVEPGLVRLATDAEALAGTNPGLAITPTGLKGALDALLDGAPAALDTLNELAEAINDDATFFTTVNGQITNLQDQINSLSGGGASNQAEVDRIEAGVGLGSTGLYVSRSGTNYLDSASSIVGELTALDTQVKSNEDSLATKATAIQLSALDLRVTNAESDIDAEEVKSADFESRITSLEGGGSLSAIQAEVDAIESSVGLGSDGTLGSYANNNFYSATATIKAAVAGVDAQAKDNETDITAQGVRITALESASTNQAEVDAIEAGVGLSAAGAHVARSGTNFLDAATSIVGEISLLDAQVKTNESDITSIEAQITSIVSEGDTSEAAIVALQSELDATQTGAGLSGAGNYTAPGVSNYLSGASTLKAADSLLDTQIKTNETAIATKASSSSVSANTSSISTNTSNISSNASDISAAEIDIAANTSAIAGKAASSTTTAIQTEVDAIESSVGLDSDGGITYVGTPALFSASATLKAAVQALDGEIVTNAGDILGNANQITAQIALNNTQEAAIGLSTSGTYVSRSGTNFLDSASSVVGEITALDTQLKTTQDDLDTAEASIVTNASSISTNTSNISSNDTEIQALEDLQTVQEAAIGLNANGSYTTVASSNYLESASTIKESLEALDTQLKSTQDDLDTAESTIVSHTSSLSTNASAIAANTSSITSNDTEIQALEDLADTHETAIGLNNNGTFSSFSGSNYLGAVSSIKGAISALDAKIKTKSDELDTEEAARASADNTLASSIDTVEASVGLAANGSLSISGTNFLNSSSTIVAALSTLDSNQNLLSGIRTNMIASLGLSTTGEKNDYANTNFISNSEDVIEAIEALDRQVKTNETDISSVSGGSISALQTEVDAIETAAGLSSSGTYVAHSGSNYMDSASTMKAAREALDTQLKTTQDDLDTAEAAIVSNDSDITALQTRATSLEVRCGGMMRNSAGDSCAVMDDSPIIRGHAGPFAYNLGASYLGGFGAGGFEFDFIFYGTSAQRCSDIHFETQSNGDSAFTGHTSSPANL